MKKPIRILLVGARGRMGKAIAAAAKNRSEVTISGKVDRNDPLDLSIHDSDVVIDFSHTEATELVDRKSTPLNSSHYQPSRMPSSA